MNNMQYVRPREKLQQKGARALSTTELLQVIIGSGNAQASVHKIAKKVAKVLQVHGSTVHPKELLAIQGIGNVKTGQIVALFELAARFPALSKGDIFDSKDSLKILYQTLTAVSRQTLLYISFDAARRVINEHIVIIDKSISIPKHVQRIFADCITESATSVVIAIGFDKQQLEPELTELNFIRDIYKTSNLLGILVRQFVLVSKEGENILKESEA